MFALIGFGSIVSVCVSADLQPNSSQQAENGNGSKSTFDSDSRTPLAFEITPELSLGGKLNVELKLKNDEDFDAGKPDRLASVESLFSLAALYQPSPDIEIFAETRFSHENPFEDTSGKKEEGNLIEFREGYIHHFLAEPISFQIGRQKLSDSREWLYDERLDAVRVLFEEGAFSAELSISSMLVDPDGDEDEITNYIASATYTYAKKSSISLYGIAREDRGKKDRDPVFVGLSWRDRPKKRQQFWLDSAVLLGHDRKKDLLGVGFDAGWSQQFKHPLKPSVTLAYAFGSGDSNPKDNKDHNFQQTDLQDNTGKFVGKTKFSYYGEVFDPELSNMMIFTVGVGVVPSESVSLDIVYHYYMLVELDDELRDAAVEEDLTGNNKRLGHEVDLIVGMEFAENIRGSFTADAFLPGSAFEKDHTAYSTQFKIQISF